MNDLDRLTRLRGQYHDLTKALVRAEDECHDLESENAELKAQLRSKDERKEHDCAHIRDLEQAMAESVEITPHEIEAIGIVAGKWKEDVDRLKAENERVLEASSYFERRMDEAEGALQIMIQADLAAKANLADQLREALAFYADETRWACVCVAEGTTVAELTGSVALDAGSLARTVLAEMQEEAR